MIQFNLVTSLLLSIFCLSSTTSDDGEAIVLINPLLLKMATGDSQTISCSLGGTGNTTSISWQSPDGNLVESSVDSSIYASPDGVLHLSNLATVNQSGDYNCTVSYTLPINASLPDSLWLNETASASVPVSIYVMPTYLKEGLIILGINVVLAGAFVGYSAKTMAEDRKRLKQYEKR